MRLRHLILALGGLVVGALLSELLARVIAPSVGEDLLSVSPTLAPAGLLAWGANGLEPVPGFTGQAEIFGNPIPLRINSLGLRGPEPTADRRWLLLGDSFTMAIQVPEEATFASLLGEKSGVQALNAGVNGYSTWPAVRRYRVLRAAVDADTVVLTFFLGNDIADNALKGGMLHPPLEAPRDPNIGLGPVRRFFLSHSVLLACLRVAERRHAVESGRDPAGARLSEELSLYSVGGAARLDTLMRSTSAALAEFRDEARAHGDRAVVAIAPPSFAVDPEMAARLLAQFRVTDPDIDAPRRALLAALDALGLPACDLTPPLAAAVARGESPYFRFDGHWNAVGHRVVAETLAECLKDTHVSAE